MSDAEGGVDLAALALGGDTTALIANLEAMAASLEAESGVAETEIRQKIAQLRSVIEMQLAVLAQQRAQLDSALRTAEAVAGDEAGDSALQTVVADSVARVEENVAQVEAMVRDDPEARTMLAEVLSRPG